MGSMGVSNRGREIKLSVMKMIVTVTAKVSSNPISWTRLADSQTLNRGDLGLEPRSIFLPWKVMFLHGPHNASVPTREQLKKCNR